MRREYLITVSISVLATLVALTPIGYVAYKNRPARIATVDLQKLIEEEQKRTMDLLNKGGSVSDEQRATVEKLTIDFAKKLSTTVDDIGADCHCVIVNKAALLGGTTIDYTDVVRERIKR